jgi:predicted RNase H-like HicB family nuclease
MAQEQTITTHGIKSYVFPVGLEEEEDGRWSAWIDALPGCAAWGYTREEALQAIQDAAQLYVEDMVKEGEEIPSEGVLAVEAPVVTVTARR